MKLIGRYYLLCDACNWEFTGFALPGTVSSKATKRKSKQDAANVSPIEGGLATKAGVPEFEGPGRKRRKKVRSRTRD